MKLNGFMMITRQQRMPEYRLMGDSPEQVAIESSSWHRTAQGYTVYSQLAGQLCFQDFCVSHRVSEGGESMRSRNLIWSKGFSKEEDLKEVLPTINSSPPFW